MLVDADRIEAELLGIDEGIDVTRVFLRTLHRVVEAVRQYHPGRAVLGRLREIERPVGHQMKGDEFHDATPSRNSHSSPVSRTATETPFSDAGLPRGWPGRQASQATAPTNRVRPVQGRSWERQNGARLS